MSLSDDIAELVTSHYLRIERDCEEVYFCFSADYRFISRIIEAAYNLSVLTYEGHLIHGDIIIVDDCNKFISQTNWPFLRIGMEIEELDLRCAKSILGAMEQSVGVVISPGNEDRIRVEGLLRQRYRPLVLGQKGIVMGVHKWLPLVVSIQGPGRVIVAIDTLLLAVRSGDRVQSPRIPQGYAELGLTLMSLAAAWGDSKELTSFICGLVYEIVSKRRGGALVIGPRANMDDRSLVNKCIKTSGISIPAFLVSDDELVPDLDDWYKLVNDEKSSRFQQSELSYIKKVRLRDEAIEIMSALSVIDGAVLVDHVGEVYAYNVYFSAKSVPSPEEGSRHSSVKQFMRDSGAWLAIIVSQDERVTALSLDYGTGNILENVFSYSLVT